MRTSWPRRLIAPLTLALGAIVLLFLPWSPLRFYPHGEKLEVAFETSSDPSPDEGLAAVDETRRQEPDTMESVQPVPSAVIVEGASEVSTAQSPGNDDYTLAGETRRQEPDAMESVQPVPSATIAEGAAEVPTAQRLGNDDPAPAEEARRQEQDATDTAQPISTVTPTEMPLQTLPTKGPQDIAALIEATQDPEWKVRWDAVNALGELRDPRAIPALVERALHDDNSHPRWRSLWALKRVEPDGRETIRQLLAALESADPVVVRNAAVALAFFDQPEALPELLRGLQDPDGFRQWEAVFSMRGFRDPQVAAALIQLLEDEMVSDLRVRQEVVLALGDIGGGHALTALLNALQEDESPQVRWRAAMALARLGDVSVVGALEAALSEEKDPQARKFIEDAIVDLRGG